MKSEFVCQFRVGNVLIEFIVIFWCDFILVSYPNSCYKILLLTINKNWIIDEIWISGDGFKDFTFLAEISLFWFKVNDNFCSSTLKIILSFRNLKGSCTIWNPHISFIWSITLAYNLYSITHNEWWVKSNTKLPNDLIVHLRSNLF